MSDGHGISKAPKVLFFRRPALRFGIGFYGGIRGRSCANLDNPVKKGYDKCSFQKAERWWQSYAA
ncbi:MAG: hypothetical protein HFH85_03425 [Lachnospiraceae bacterium]|nr:hypothetical protein [Lachnospiraceae bacterium]